MLKHTDVCEDLQDVTANMNQCLPIIEQLDSNTAGVPIKQDAEQRCQVYFVTVLK